MLKYGLTTFLIFVCSFIEDAVAQPAAGWQEEANINEVIYNAPLQIISGAHVSIHQLAAQNPLVVAFVFTRCSGICTPLIIQLKESLQFAPNIANKKYNVLVVSFDPRDSVKDMENMATRFNLQHEGNWEFAVTDSISRLISSVNFNPVWDEKTLQFDHDALLVGVNSQGFVTKKLLGLRNSKDIGLLINSINNVFSPTYRLPAQSNLFSCYNYNPKTGKNTPGLGMLFIALPAILSFLILIFIRLVSKSKSV